MRKVRPFVIALVLVASVPAYAAAPPTHQQALEQYRAAMGRLRVPANFVFDYVITRVSPKRVVTEKHRVYRNDAGDERNETSARNGANIVPAFVRIFHRPTWPYGVERFLVTPDAYDARYEGMATVNGRLAFAYALTPKASADFGVNAIFIDLQRRLPLREMFTVAGGGCAGRGWIDFAPTGGHWMVSAVTAMCTPPSADQSSAPQTQSPADMSRPPQSSAQYRESIHFSNYRFPVSIPADVFKSPGAASPAAL